MNKLMNKQPLKFFLSSNTLGALIGKCLLMLLIPYAYLFACGLVFDMWLKWYFMTTFIFVSLIILYVIAIALVVIAIRNYKKAKKKGGKV